jgi:pullulanase/glycogen debranching enzyme
MTARGAVMLHVGQEFARSKVIADTDVPGTHPGLLDHNSYEKDDATNWIDYTHADANRELLAYYRGLIAIRRRFRTLRHAPVENYHFLSADVPMAGGFEVKGIDGEEDLIVLINGNHHETATYRLTEGSALELLADAHAAGTAPMRGMAENAIAVGAGCCMILSRKRRPESSR